MDGENLLSNYALTRWWSAWYGRRKLAIKLCLDGIESGQSDKDGANLKLTPCPIRIETGQSDPDAENLLSTLCPIRKETGQSDTEAENLLSTYAPSE